MGFTKPIIFSLLIFCSFFLSAQETLVHTEGKTNYQRGVELLEKEKYNTAQKFFEASYKESLGENSEISALSRYYIAYCAVRLFNEDSEYLTLKFIAENPDHPWVNDAYFNLAGYFYARKKWKEGIKYYDKTEVQKLTEEQQAEYYFKHGYAHFSDNNPEKAKVSFYRITDIDTKYTPPAVYYYSHIHYDEGNYQTALNGFLKLTGDNTFGPIAPYYIVQIYYKQGRYQEIVDFAPGMMDKITSSRLAEVARITAEAYAQLGMYKESTPYFRTFLDSAKVVRKEDKYQAGYAFYKAEAYADAIGALGSISNTHSALGQNAAYYLADCYLKSGDKQNARLAFQSASSMNYDPVIQQDALFNYALISYELGNDPFNEAIRAFEEFISRYPESKRIDEAYRFLIQAYLNARNYKLAMVSMEKSELRTDDMKRAYQKIAFFRGIELFNNLDYPSAIRHFDKSLQHGSYNQMLKARALFWKGEAHYRTENYPEAVRSYTEFKNSSVAYTLAEFGTIDYNIGYCYFRQRNYPKAIESLRKFTTEAGAAAGREKADALNRIADCYYAQTDYYAAADFYGRVVAENQGDVEYAMLQMGICEGLANKDIQKIKTLQDLVTSYPGSGYVDDALYEMAQSYVKLQNTERAIEKLQIITREHSQSNYAPPAYVQIGLLYYNMDNNQAAIKYYKDAISLFPGTQISKDALFGLKSIYVDENRVDEYFAFVNSLGQGAPAISANEQDSLTFVAAEKLYMGGDCTGASKSLERYISEFPAGSFLVKAHFYKGDCNYSSKEYDKALTSFNYILAQPRNNYTEQSLLGAARIEMNNKNYLKAIGRYNELVNSFGDPANTREAKMALMRAYYRLNNYDEALRTAREVQGMSKLSAEHGREATYIAARSLQETGRDALALEEYKKISDEVMSQEGAEAKFRLAELYFKRQEYSAAEKQILDFSEKTTPHEYWIARSFILWGDIFARKKEYFQAIQTLQSIIDYYAISDDGILETAKARKASFVALQEANEQPAEREPVEINIE
jgi:TolA-binding protein